METKVKVIVAGELRIAEGRRDEFIERSQNAIKQARLNDECMDFAVSADSIDQDRVNIFESWRSKSALIKFRDSGPEDGLSELIVDANVAEFRVVSELF